MKELWEEIENMQKIIDMNTGKIDPPEDFPTFEQKATLLYET